MPTTGDAPVPRGPSRVEAVELVFVYNAPDGVIAALGDMIHKIVSPSTYPCSLCAVTYGAVAMRRDWKTYLARLPHRIKFYHRDGFARAFPGLDIAPPAILIADAVERVWATAATAGSSILVVDAINDRAAAFYEGNGFVRLPDSQRLVLPMHTIQRLVER